MDRVHVIRHKVLVEGRSARAVAQEMSGSRNTVKLHLAMAAPARTEQGPRERPVWAKVEARVQEVLEDSPRWTQGKQRLKLAPELGHMLPIPDAPFDARRTLSLGVSQRSLVTLEGTTYSVPCRWAGSESMAALRNGVQRALFQLGRVPQWHQTDNSTAATHQNGASIEAL